MDTQGLDDPGKFDQYGFDNFYRSQERCCSQAICPVITTELLFHIQLVSSDLMGCSYFDRIGPLDEDALDRLSYILKFARTITIK